MCGCQQNTSEETLSPVEMLKDLNDIANELDESGYYSYASEVQNIMKRIARNIIGTK